MEDVKRETPGEPVPLRFLWWNVQEFAHFDIAHTIYERWPKSKEEYFEKRRRVQTVLSRFCENHRPHLMAFAEITEQAAIDLRDQSFPEYKVFSLPSLHERLDFNIALIYHPTVGFEGEDFLQVSNVPGSTRPMVVIHFRFRKHLIRFYACHWTARLADTSDKWRMLTAQQLNVDCYEFLRSRNIADESRHLLIVGDLNEEPYGLLENWLYAHRDRASSNRPLHYSDKDQKRLHLYNCSWRLLGQQLARPSKKFGGDVAGSYYRRSRKTWHTFDQVIVSGSLLSEEPPYLDEEYLQRESFNTSLLSEFLASDGLPYKFEWKNGAAIGLSDHLPLCGRIILV